MFNLVVQPSDFQPGGSTERFQPSDFQPGGSTERFQPSVFDRAIFNLAIFNLAFRTERKKVGKSWCSNLVVSTERIDQCEVE
jgi:hypothetical protein